MKELVEKLVGALVDSPEEVEVYETEGTNMTLVQVKVAKHDVGKLIGKKGKNITALRTIVAGAGKGKRFMVEVVGENRHTPGDGRLPDSGEQKVAEVPGETGDGHEEGREGEPGS